MTCITVIPGNLVYPKRMKTLVLYDSVYGNTEKIAQAIAEGIAKDVEVKTIKDVTPDELRRYELLVIGSPVHGGMPTPAMDKYIKGLPKKSLENVLVTTFDTRFAVEGQSFGIKLLLNLIQYAAEKMSAELVKKGATLRANPQGFIVQEKEGPLRTGELERAKTWGATLVG